MATTRTTLALGTIAGVCCDELKVVYRTKLSWIEREGSIGVFTETEVNLVDVDLDGSILDELGQPVTITDEQRIAILAAAERKIEEWI